MKNQYPNLEKRLKEMDDSKKKVLKKKATLDPPVKIDPPKKIVDQKLSPEQKEIIEKIKDVASNPEIRHEQKPPPTRRDREIALKELELQAISKYMGEKHQNTQISRDERILLAVILHDLAINPWAISKRICQEKGIPFNETEFEIDFIKDFVADYLDFGLPIDRLGRGEVKEIFKAYFEGETQKDEKKDEKLIS